MESVSPAATPTSEWRAAGTSQDIECVPATKQVTPEALIDHPEPAQRVTLLKALSHCLPAAVVPFAATIYVSDALSTLLIVD